MYRIRFFIIERRELFRGFCWESKAWKRIRRNTNETSSLDERRAILSAQAATFPFMLESITFLWSDLDLTSNRSRRMESLHHPSAHTTHELKFLLQYRSSGVTIRIGIDRNLFDNLRFQFKLWLVKIWSSLRYFFLKSNLRADCISVINRFLDH